MSTLFLPFSYPDYPADQVEQHIKASVDWMEDMGISLVTAPPIVTLADCEAAIELGKKDTYDSVVVLLATWIEAPNVMRVLASAGLEKTPMLLWSHDNVWDDQEKATISFGAVASAGVMREAFEEFGYPFRFVVGNPRSDKLGQQIWDFCRAAKAVRSLKSKRLGLMGYASMGMYTGLGAHIKIRKQLGVEVCHLDHYSLLAHLDNAAEEDILAQEEDLRKNWNIAPVVTEDLLRKTAKIKLRLEQLCKENQLDALTVKCQYEMSKDFGFSPCVALSLLGEKMPVSCEGDVNLLLSQMILSEVTGEVTTYGDVLSFLDNGMICAACGFAPKPFLAAERPTIEKHTAICTGMLITTPFKAQEVTVIRVANCGDGFKMHLIAGHTEEMKHFHEIGCPAYAGSVIRFDNKTVEDFQQEIMSQHYAIVPGNHVEALKQFCKLTNIKVV